MNFDALNLIAVAVKRTAEEHGFTDATPGEDMALIHSEVSEALEEIRDHRPMDRMYYLTSHKEETAAKEADGQLTKPCGVPSEMADIIIRVLHFSAKHGIDIGQAIKEKMAYNDSRPFKHGGKKL